MPSGMLYDPEPFDYRTFTEPVPPREEPMPETLTVETTSPSAPMILTFKREYALRDVGTTRRGRQGGRYNTRIDAEHDRDRLNHAMLTASRDPWSPPTGSEYVLERRFLVEFGEDLTRAPGIRRYRDLLSRVLALPDVHVPRNITEDSFVREYMVGFTAARHGAGRGWAASSHFRRWSEAKSFRDQQNANSERYCYGEVYSIRLRMRTMFRQTPEMPSMPEPRVEEWEDLLVA